MKKWLALLAAALALRSAGFVFGVLNIDESDFCVFGRRILEGAIPYVGVVDHKPPLTYLSFIPAGLFGGVSIYPMRVLGIIWLVLTCLIVARAAKLWTKSDSAYWAAAWLTLFANLVELPTVASELLLNLPAAGALYYFIRAKGRDFLYCGLCIGIASLFKHQAGILLPALGLALVLSWFPGFLRGCIALAIGFAIPWLLSIGFYAAIGHLPEFMDWVVWRNLSYASKARAISPWPLLLHGLLVCIGATLVPWILAIQESFKPTQPDRRIYLGIAGSLWLTWIAVGSGGRYYEHYFVQFAPPLALLAAPRAGLLIDRFAKLLRSLRAALVAGLLLPALISVGYSYARGYLHQYAGQEPKSLAIADWLRKNTAPSDTLFVWGHYSPIYSLSQRMPGTRYITASVHVGNFDPGQLPARFNPSLFRSENDIANTLRDLESNRVPIVIDTSPADIHGWGKMPLSALPDLKAYIDAHYRPIATAGGAVLYRRL